MMSVRRGDFGWTTLLTTTFYKRWKRDPRVTVLVEENGTHLLLTSESCHRNGPSPTPGEMNIKRASFHKPAMRKRAVHCLLARFPGLCPTSRGAEREDPALWGNCCQTQCLSQSSHFSHPPHKATWTWRILYFWQTILKTCESKCYHLSIKYL